MKPAPKLKVTLLIILLAVVSIVGIRYVMWSKSKLDAVAAARQKGSPSAPIKIVEYVDLQCPACAYGSQQIQQYLDQYPEKFFIEVKIFPLGSHVHSLLATKFARCAAEEGRFWEFLDKVFQAQRQWSPLLDAQPTFVDIIKSMGLDESKIITCTAKDELRSRILEEKDAGAALGIKSTPTYFINGKMFVGVMPMMQEVDRILGVKTKPVDPETLKSKPGLNKP